MKFRYARHTTDLARIEKFYTEIVGLEKLGSFHNHAYYDGVFLGIPRSDWHLEFTASNEKPQHTFDEDDALVFYVKNESKLVQIRNRFLQQGIQLEQPKNPYWVENGIMIADPDGYKIIFSIRD